MSRHRRLAGDGLVAGRAKGPVLRLQEPVSFWGGVDHGGVISDVHHPQRGASVAGQVLVLPSGRGSSSSSSVLAELIHAGHGPVALVTSSPDPILVLGALVPALLYAESVPVLVLPRADLDLLCTGALVRVVVPPLQDRVAQGWLEELAGREP